MIQQTTAFRAPRSVFAAALGVLLLAPAAHAQFYQPERGTPVAPVSPDYTVTRVTIPNGDAELAGWVLEPRHKAVCGTVVFCHGNAGNLDDHVAFADFLPKYGYRVVMFDYQGYGESSPHEPTRETTVSDVSAAIDFATDRWGQPWLMGHSLGASLAISVAGKQHDDVRGVIAIAPFTSYRAVARAVLRRRLASRTLVVPSYLLIRRGDDPIDHVAAISPTPLLLVHGEDDDLIPPRMSRELYERARDPKDILIVRGAGHNSGWNEMGPKYVDKVVDFLARDHPAPPIRSFDWPGRCRSISRSSR